MVANWVGDIGAQNQKAAKNEIIRNKSLAEEAKRSGNEEEVARFEKLATQAKENYESWGDNGANRIALHAGTQGLIGALVGGGVGALGSASGVVGGNLGQKLGKELAEKEAERLKLDDVERLSLINSYQQMFASLGGAVGGLAAAGASGQTGVGALSSVAQGSGSATAVDVNNRQLHTEEIGLIDKLAKEKAKVECRNPSCEARYAIVMADAMERTAKGLVDDKEYAKNMAYLQELVQASSDPNSEGDLAPV